MEQQNPFFSIVIPTYNRPKQLAKCLKSLSHLDYPRDRFEVIVVDDGSPIIPEGVVADFRRQLNMILLTQARKGPAGARNTGVNTAKGDFLAFIDDDCEPATNWLRNLSTLFLLSSERAIGGRTINGYPNNLYSVTSQTIIDVAYAYYNPDPNQACFFASNNFTVAADLFHDLGGFDVTFMTSEDRDFCDRWHHHGFKMTYVPEVILYHFHELKFSTFWRQHFNYGRGAYRFHRAKAKRGTGPEHFRPDLKFYRHLFLKPLKQEQGARVLWVTMFLILSQIASTFGFLREWLDQIKKR
jgi:GT2 family glycosyltransferase